MPLQIEKEYEAKESSSSNSEAEQEDDKNVSVDDFNDRRNTRREKEVIQYTSGNHKKALFIFRADALFINLTHHKNVAEEYQLAYDHSKGTCLLLQSLMSCHGIKQQQTPEGKTPSEFNFLWTGGHLKTQWLSSLSPCQRVNHFPKSTELTRKDRLFQNIEHMQCSKGFEHFNIAPLTFILPREYHKFFIASRKEKCFWIVKPPASSRGRGIYLVDQPDKVAPDETAVVSQYICNPLLINSFKFDVRLYVAVTSFDPLVIYLYEDGLTRFATLPFDNSASSIVQQCIHLTNYSINKKSSHFVRNTDASADDMGSKWSFKGLLRHLKDLGIDTMDLMASIEDVIIKSLMSVEWIISSSCRAWVPYANNCFELYGFDILIDDHLKPWLLEVNLTPSLACDSPLDLNVKANVITDLLNLVGIECQDPGTLPSESARTQSRKKFMSKAQLWWRRRHSHKKTMSTYVKRRRGVHLAMGMKGQVAVNEKGWEEADDGWVGELTSGERRLMERLKGEWTRKGGFVRIFPAPNSWNTYGPLFVSTNHRNSFVYNQLFNSRHQFSSSSADTDLISRCAQYYRKLPTSLDCHKLSRGGKGPLEDDHPFVKLIRKCSSEDNSQAHKDTDGGGQVGVSERGVGKDDIPLPEYFKHLVACKLACLSVPQLKLIYKEYMRRKGGRKAARRAGVNGASMDEVVDMIGGCGIDNRQQTLSNNHSDSVSKGCFTEGEVLQLLRVASTKELQDLLNLHTNNNNDSAANEKLPASTNGHAPSATNHRLDRAKSCKPIMRRHSKHALINALDSKPKNRPITSTLTRSIKVDRNNHHSNNHSHHNHHNNRYSNSAHHHNNHYSNSAHHHNNSIHSNHFNNNNNQSNNANDQPPPLLTPLGKKATLNKSMLIANDRMAAKEKLTTATNNKKLPISSSSLTQALSIYGTQHRTFSAKQRSSPPRAPSPCRSTIQPSSATNPLHQAALPSHHTMPPFDVKATQVFEGKSKFLSKSPSLHSSTPVRPSSANSTHRKSSARQCKKHKVDGVEYNGDGGDGGDGGGNGDGEQKKVSRVECFNGDGDGEGGNGDGGNGDGGGGDVLMTKSNGIDDKRTDGSDYDDDSFDTDDGDDGEDEKEKKDESMHTIRSWSKKRPSNYDNKALTPRNISNNNNIYNNNNNNNNSRIEVMRKCGYNVVGCVAKNLNGSKPSHHDSNKGIYSNGSGGGGIGSKANSSLKQRLAHVNKQYM